MAQENDTPREDIRGERTMERDAAFGLRDELLAAFRRHNLDVGLGITANGIAILSQDERVDASNIDLVTPYAAKATNSG